MKVRRKINPADEPLLSGPPEGRIGQPFCGWFRVMQCALARLNGLLRMALATPTIQRLKPLTVSTLKRAKMNARLQTSGLFALRESRLKAARLFCSLLLLPFAFCLLPSARAQAQVSDFLGRRVTSVNVEIEGAPGSTNTEMRSLIDVAPGQDFSPVRIHDSLVRLHRSGLISGARVEAAPDASNGVALRFIVRPQARIESVEFEGSTIFPIIELRSRLNQLDPGERLSAGAVTRGLGELYRLLLCARLLQSANNALRFDSTRLARARLWFIKSRPASRLACRNSISK